MSSKLKIFVSAYACEPGLGSEIGVGWHWVLEMSKTFELWVLTRQSNRQRIQAWIDKNPEYRKIHFLFYDLPRWARFWKKGLRGVRTYYNIWQWRTNGIVRRTMQENGIDIFHHLTYGNALWKVSSYGQKQLFIWGPIGGLETIPSDFSRHYPWKSRIVELIRRWVIATLPLNRAFRNRCKHAELILCKTEDTYERIPSAYRNKAVIFTDVAVDFNQKVTVPPTTESTTVKFLAVGRLDPWRGFDLLVEAFARAKETAPSICLEIVGKGMDSARLKKLIDELHMQNSILLTGQISQEAYTRKMAACDVVVNPSLKEGAVTVSFDSMALAKPLLCLDTSGYTRYFSNEYAVVIPRNSRERIIEDLHAAILRLTDKKERQTMGESSRIHGQDFTWEKHGREISQLITERVNRKKHSAS